MGKGKKAKKDKGSEPEKKPEERSETAATKVYREALARLNDGDIVRGVKGMLRVLEEFPAAEEAYFAEEQIRRLERVYPAEMKEAGFDAPGFEAGREKRRASIQLDLPIKLLVGFVFAATAWVALLAIAPGIAMIGKGPEVPIILRIVAGIGAALGAWIAWGFLKMRWEAVNFFIVWLPPLLVLTFIGVIESPDFVARALTIIAFAAEIAAAWYVARFSKRFVY